MNTAAIGVACEAAPGEGASLWKRLLGPVAIGVDGGWQEDTEQWPLHVRAVSAITV